MPEGMHAPVNPEDLAAHNCIVYTRQLNSHAWTFKAGSGAQDAQGTSRTVRVAGHIQTNSSEVIRDAVINGMHRLFADLAVRS